MDDSKSSSEESCENSSKQQADQQAVNNEEGTGRSYECVFCKRGFTTAQALGGHMNIHRKDRAKVSRQPSSAITTVPVSNQPVECIRPAAGFINQLHQSTIISTHQQAAGAQVNCQMYFPASTSSPSIDQYNNFHQPLYYGIEERDLMSRSFEQDWCPPSLSLKIGPSCIEDNNKNNQPAQDGEEECQVDLELRLGPDP